MPIFKLMKLVRDKIVDHQLALGEHPTYRALTKPEHQKALVDKIAEEASEILHAQPQDRASEIADVQQALDDLAKSLGVSKKAIAVAQTKKKQKNGAFKKGLFVEHLETAEKDPWTAYYRKDPDRFPEL